MKNWKPKSNEWVWIPDFPDCRNVQFKTSKNLKKWHKANLVFKTKALAQSALKDVKAVLKKARKA